ncbi:MAG: hyi [Burkholderiaceae bacterium]|nr:hyi [Burkholderiaceae bacterium]
MPKLAANLSMMFTEVPFMDRFDAAAKAGFKGVEFLFPYEFDLNQIADKLKSNNLQLVLHNLPAGNWAGGERGITCHPDRVGEFQDGVGKGIEAAKKLGVPQLNALAGKLPEGVSADKARATFVSNLKFAAEKLKAEGIRLITEPINTFDIPGFFLNRTQQAVDIIKDVGSDNLFIQHDIYHMQRMEGELANTIKANIGLIKHMQLADNPGRNEPGTGEINYKFLFKFIDDLGYDGWIGCEYKPLTTTEAGLGWLKAHGA